MASIALLLTTLCGCLLGTEAYYPYENIARGKPAWQSSTGYGGYAGRAVDGNARTTWPCTSTNEQFNPKWRVNLLDDYQINNVIVYNRMEFSNRLSYFTVRVLNRGLGQVKYCGSGGNMNGRPTAAVDCGGAVGSYVEISLPGKGYLTLCEVEIMGTPYTPTPAVDGGWSAWSNWGGCSRSCGGGMQSSTRSCNNPVPSNGGAQCVGPASREQACNTHGCPVDGGFTHWSVWSPCSVSCGGGSQRRVRACTNPPPSNGGRPCGTHTEELTQCNQQPCTKPTTPRFCGARWVANSGCPQYGQLRIRDMAGMGLAQCEAACKAQANCGGFVLGRTFKHCYLVKAGCTPTGGNAAKFAIYEYIRC